MQCPISLLCLPPATASAAQHVITLPPPDHCNLGAYWEAEKAAYRKQCKSYNPREQWARAAALRKAVAAWAVHGLAKDRCSQFEDIECIRAAAAIRASIDIYLKVSEAAIPLQPAHGNRPMANTTQPVHCNKATPSTTQPVHGSKPTPTTTQPVHASKPAVITNQPEHSNKPTPITTQPVHASKPAVITKQPVHSNKPSPITTKPAAPQVQPSELSRSEQARVAQEWLAESSVTLPGWRRSTKQRAPWYSRIMSCFGFAAAGTMASRSVSWFAVAYDAY